MVVGRGSHTATLLQTGRVLIAGGTSTPGSVPDAELYDPVTEAFTRTGSMAAGRAAHTATLLENGQVLIAGGIGNDSNKELSSAELYDPNTGVFISTGPMVTSRAAHAATLLQDGRVLIAGGDGSARAEIYDPSIGTFGSAGALDQPREGSTATRLKNGKVLIAGGEYLDCNTPASEPCNLIFFGAAELYYPAAGIFTATGSLSAGRILHTATLLSDGTVLLTGGQIFTIDPTTTTTVLSSAELYEPATGTFMPAASLIAKREKHTATLLQDGTVLIAGGTSDIPASAELYDPSTGNFTPSGFLATLRDSHTATLLPNGQVLIAGGFGQTNYSTSPPLASAELYDPILKRFTAPGAAVLGLVDAGGGGRNPDAPSPAPVDATDSERIGDSMPAERVDVASIEASVDAPALGLVDAGRDSGAQSNSDSGAVHSQLEGGLTNPLILGRRSFERVDAS
jgi:hypothetical protein